MSVAQMPNELRRLHGNGNSSMFCVTCFCPSIGRTGWTLRVRTISCCRSRAAAYRFGSGQAHPALPLAYVGSHAAT